MIDILLWRVACRTKLQESAARKMVAKLAADKAYGNAIATEIAPPIDPKAATFRKQYFDRLKK